jgi:hypothetical protein
LRAVRFPKVRYVPFALFRLCKLVSAGMVKEQVDPVPRPPFKETHSGPHAVPSPKAASSCGQPFSCGGQPAIMLLSAVLWRCTRVPDALFGTHSHSRMPTCQHRNICYNKQKFYNRSRRSLALTSDSLGGQRNSDSCSRWQELVVVALGFPFHTRMCPNTGASVSLAVFECIIGLLHDDAMVS